MKPLVKWSGGKGDEISYIEKHIPEHYKLYIEPFVGGGALFFHLNPKASVISDVHKDLIDLYTCMKEGYGRDIYDWMSKHPNDEETYYYVRDVMPVSTPLDNAKRFYYQRKTCFRGMLRYNKKGHFNIPFGRYKTMNYEALLDDRLYNIFQNTTILNDSFEKIFQDYNDPTNFVFLDPPYDSEFTDYGYCSFGREEHEKLAECFKTTKNKCLMVIGSTPFIEQLYDGYVVERYPKKYKFKLHSGRVGDEINKEHIIIKNY